MERMTRGSGQLCTSIGFLSYRAQGDGHAVGLLPLGEGRGRRLARGVPDGCDGGGAGSLSSSSLPGIAE